MAGRSKRKPNDDKAFWFVVVVFGLAAVGWALRELETHWWIGLLLALAAIAVTAVWVQAERAKRIATAARAAALSVDILAIDAASPAALEHTVAALLERDGFSAKVTGKAGDQGVDVLARDGAGHVVAVQCKHKKAGEMATKKVGQPDLYPVSGNHATVYRANLAALVTNGGITATGRRWAAESIHRVRLVDRAALTRWGAGQVAAASLFGIAQHVPHPHSAGGIAAGARRRPVAGSTIPEG